MKHIALDSAPLGLISKPAQTPDVVAITKWATACLVAGHKIYLPEVIDYEIRRELIRAKKIVGIAKLDALRNTFRYLPITSLAMQEAANLWAQSRQQGTPTGDPRKLDIDSILSAQARTLSVAPGDEIVVATTNVGHLSQFVHAETLDEYPTLIFSDFFPSPTLSRTPECRRNDIGRQSRTARETPAVASRARGKSVRTEIGRTVGAFPAHRAFPGAIGRA